MTLSSAFGNSLNLLLGLVRDCWTLRENNLNALSRSCKRTQATAFGVSSTEAGVFYGCELNCVFG